MIYVATVEHYRDWEEKKVTSFMFVCADSTVKAVEQISNYYGEEYLEDITISPFSPDNFIFLDEEYDELFHDFALHAGDNVCWQEVLMARKVNKDYVSQYSKIIMTQPLAHGKYIQLTYEKDTDGKWRARYSTNSAYHICQYDGNFRNCKDCGALDEDFDVEFCLNKEQILSAGAVSVRVNECLGSGLEVQFIDQRYKEIVMEVICKEKLNTIFWRHEHGNDWSWADLDEVIATYEDEPYTELSYWQPVRREGSEEILYHVFFCKSCDKPILAVDANHDYRYCPHCGKAIWRD